MPSRSPRSRSRSPSSRRHKKSHKRSKRSREKGSQPTTKSSVKKYESPVRENGDHDGNAPSTSFMTPPSDLTKLDLKEEEKVVTPPEDQSPGRQIDGDRASTGVHCCFLLAAVTATTTLTTRIRKRRFADETERVFLPHMPTNISTSAMTDQQQKIYIRTYC